MHSYAATGEIDTDKQSIAARKGRLVNDIQNQKGAGGLMHARASTPSAKGACGTMRTRGKQNQFRFLHGNQKETRKRRNRCLAERARSNGPSLSLAFVERQMQEIPYGKRQPATSGWTRRETCKG